MQNILLTPKSFDNSIRFQLKFREYLGTPYSPVPNNGGVLIKGGREGGEGGRGGRGPADNLNINKRGVQIKGLV